jgi:hypothetical protein
MKFPKSFVETTTKKEPVLYLAVDIDAWREEQRSKIREQEDFIEKTVKPNIDKVMDVTYTELLEEYEAYIQQVKESLE